MPQVLKAKLGAGALADIKDRLAQGLRPVLKFTRDEAEQTLRDSGDVAIRFADSQLDRIMRNLRDGKGTKITLTQAQTDRMRKEGAGLGALLPIAKVVGPAIAAPLIGEAFKGIKGLFGRGGDQPVKLGGGLYLAPPPLRGAGMADDILGLVQRAGARHGTGFPLTKTALKNMLAKIGDIALAAGGRVLERVVLDKLQGTPVTMEGLSGGGLRLGFGHETMDVKHGGFIGNLIKSFLPF